jgi:hypothetical protein
VIESNISWLDLQERLAQALNVYPASLHLQYRLSTDHPKSLPFELTSAKHLENLIMVLRPLIVPPLLANGWRSTRKMKSVLVQVFSEGDDAGVPQGDGKVRTHADVRCLI